MPLLSAFTSLGLLHLSGRPSLGEAIYQALRGDATGESYALGGHADASLYARAMALARASETARRAGNQILPTKTVDLLPAREAEYGLVPGPTDTIAQRQAALAARVLLPGGAVRGNIELVLRTLLGSAFVGLVTQAPSVYPDPGAAPGLFLPPAIPRKLFRLTTRLIPAWFAVIGGVPIPKAQQVSVVPVDPREAGSTPQPGETYVFDPDNGSLAERLTFDYFPVDVPYPGGVYQSIEVSVKPVKGHEAGAILSSQPWPFWTSASRYVLVVLTDAAAGDAEVCRQVHALLGELLRGVTQWAIVSKATGTYQLGVDPLGRTVVS